MGGGGNPGQQESNIANQDQNGANQIASEMGPIVSSLLSGINMPGINSQVFGYLLNPNGTNLAAQYPQLQSFFHNMMMNGLDPSVTANALNNFQVGGQQQINSIKNSLGAGVPNLAGTVNDLNFNSIMGRAQLGSNLAGMNQDYKAKGASALNDIATGLDTQKMGMLMAALQGGQGATTSALGVYGNMFSNYLNSAQNAAAEAGRLQASQPNFWSSLLNGVMGAGEMYASGGLSGLFGGGGSGGGGGAYMPFSPGGDYNPLSNVGL